MAEKSTLEQVGRILILVDGILIVINGIFNFLAELGLANVSLQIPDIPGNTGFGIGLLPQLPLLISIIIFVIVGLVYIAHFTGKINFGKVMVNGILFLVISLIFGGLLTILASILYIIDALS